MTFFWRSAPFRATSHDLRRSLPGEVMISNNAVAGESRNLINLLCYIMYVGILCCKRHLVPCTLAFKIMQTSQAY